MKGRERERGIEEKLALVPEYHPSDLTQPLGS